MTSFRVTITASLRPTEHRDRTTGGLFSMPDTLAPPGRLTAVVFKWASAEPDRTAELDTSMDPPRATVTAIYDVYADAEDEARAGGEERFLEECDGVDSSEWESVVAVAVESE